MELSKKTTILFPPELHRALTRVAKRMGVSIGHLVRSACEAEYGLVPEDERLRAVDELRALSLPVGTPTEMKRESVPEPEELVP